MRDIGLLIIRVALGMSMLLGHGLPKLMAFSEKSLTFPDYIGLGSTFSLCLAIFSEVFCALFLIIGFKTKFALYPLIATMVVAFFVHHSADPFGQKELAFVYLVAFIGLFFTGAGKHSADRV